MTWEPKTAGKAVTEYAYTPDRDYIIRRDLRWCGMVALYVWALFHKGQCKHEVHAMENVDIVKSDAEEFIKEARSYAA